MQASSDSLPCLPWAVLLRVTLHNMRPRRLIQPCHREHQWALRLITTLEQQLETRTHRHLQATRVLLLRHPHRPRLPDHLQPPHTHRPCRLFLSRTRTTKRAKNLSRRPSRNPRPNRNLRPLLLKALPQRGSQVVPTSARIVDVLQHHFKLNIC